MIIWLLYKHPGHHVTNASVSDKKLASSCMSVVEETSGKTMVGTDESFTEARALHVKCELETMKKCKISFICLPNI